MAEAVEPRIIRWPTDEETKAAFERYALAVGKVAHAWNYLQDRLGQLFAVSSGIEINMAYTIWHSILSDKVQRDMLKASLTRSSHSVLSSVKNAKADIDWVLKEADKVADKRNVAVHTPASIYVGSDNDGSAEMGPSWVTGNPKAARLMGKKLIEEFVWCEMCAETLTRFLDQIITGMSYPANYPWPNRPLMPTRGQKSIHRDPGTRRRGPK